MLAMYVFNGYDQVAFFNIIGVYDDKEMSSHPWVISQNYILDFIEVLVYEQISLVGMH